MKLTMLGTGNALVTECYHTCFVIEDSGQYFMVDGGGGSAILHQLKHTGYDWMDMRHIFVTHKHLDHLAILLILAMMLALSVTAFAQTHAYIEWNEEHQRYEMKVIDDGDSGPCINPQFQDYLNQNGGSGFVIVDGCRTCEIDWRDY